MTRLPYRKIILLSLLYVLLLVLPYLLGPFYLRIFLLANISAVAVLGLNFAMGYAGLINLAQAAFVGIGAYAMALLTTRAGLNPWTGLVLAPVAAGFAGWLLGWPLLRLRGHYLALATLGMNISVVIVAVNWQPVTGGADGIGGIPSLELFGLRLISDHHLFYLTWAVLAVAMLCAAAIRSSHLGMAMIMSTDDEIAAKTTAIDVPRVRLIAFTLSSMYAGVAGALYTQLQGYISPSDFDLIHSINYLAMLVVGGVGSIVGSLLGAILLTFLPEWLRFLGQTYLIFFGFGIVALLIVLPKGLVSFTVPRQGGPGGGTITGMTVNKPSIERENS